MKGIELGVFAAVAKAGSIGRAAERLNTVQSNVTQRVRALEERLGVSLFHRSKRGVTLTTAGARLLPYATRIAELLEEARLVTRDGAVPGGELRIGAMETVAAFRLPPILGAYTALYPEVEVTLETGPTEHLIERVLRRHLDGAFAAGPVAHADLEATEVFDEELVLVTSPRVVSVEDLRRDSRRAGKIIAFRVGCSYRQRTEEFLARAGLLGLSRMEICTPGRHDRLRRGRRRLCHPAARGRRGRIDGRARGHPRPPGRDRADHNRLRSAAGHVRDGVAEVLPGPRDGTRLRSRRRGRGWG